MYERTYGYRYGETAEASTTEIARRIREDVKVAKAEGLLPTRWSYSVRSQYFAGGSAIDVQVKNCADAWETCDGGQRCRNPWCVARRDPAYAAHASEHLVLTDEAEAAKITLERIHGAYNHDGSEVQVDYFDVNYYGSVSFDDPSTTAWRAEEAAKKAARKAATAAGQIVGRIRVYGREKRTVHLVVETTDGKQRLACGATLWRSSLTSKVDDSEPLTCSRCAKKV